MYAKPVNLRDINMGILYLIVCQTYNYINYSLKNYISLIFTCTFVVIYIILIEFYSDTNN